MHMQPRFRKSGNSPHVHLHQLLIVRRDSWKSYLKLFEPYFCPSSVFTSHVKTVFISRMKQSQTTASKCWFGNASYSSLRHATETHIWRITVLTLIRRSYPNAPTSTTQLFMLHSAFLSFKWYLINVRNMMELFCYMLHRKYIECLMIYWIHFGLNGFSLFTFIIKYV